MNIEKVIKPLEHAWPRTQKARGVKVAHLAGDPVSSAYAVRPSGSLLFVSSKMPILKFKKSPKVPVSYNSLMLGVAQPTDSTAASMMARPCPSVPRHGFVESRVVHNWGELHQIIQETRKADPRGEVLLMDYLEPLHSSVVTEGGITIGASNDGATGGGESYTIPCSGDVRAFIKGYPVVRNTQKTIIPVCPLKYVGLRPPTRSPYLEFVNNKLVQIRYGPQVNAQQNTWSLKNAIYVSKVWTPMEYEIHNFAVIEAHIKTLANDSGSVVYLSEATLASHIAVQAISAGVSVVTGTAEKPEKGFMYSFNKPTTVAPVLDHLKLADTFTFAEQYVLNPNYEQRDLHWAVAVIQGMAGTPNSVIRTLAIVIASTIILRYGLAACFGEHRRYYSHGPAKFKTAGALAPIGLTKTFGDTDTKMEVRSYVQAYILQHHIGAPKEVHNLLGRLTALEYDFNNGEWRAGFGGPSWGNCTAAVKELYLTWLSIYTQRNTYGYTVPIQQLIGACNKFITTSHNSGKCLTKFMYGTHMLTCSVTPSIFLNHPLTLNLARVAAGKAELTQHNKEQATASLTVLPNDEEPSEEDSDDDTSGE